LCVDGPNCEEWRKEGEKADECCTTTPIKRVWTSIKNIDLELVAVCFFLKKDVSANSILRFCEK